jgi:hypothetical protein
LTRVARLLQPADDPLQFTAPGGLVGDLSGLRLQLLDPLFQAADAGLKLVLVEVAFSIAIDEPGNALTQADDLLL